jgi:hypothetical protein
VAAVAHHDGRHPLTNHCVGPWVALQGEVAVGMDVDEPRRSYKSRHVDDPRAGGPDGLRNIGDSALVHRNVRPAGLATGAIHKQPAP